MTTTTRNNHLADDLAAYMAEDGWDAGITLLDEALAAERRATVERIRTHRLFVKADLFNPDGGIGAVEAYFADDLDAILDEEAARV